MEFRILGSLEVADGERVVSLPRRKHRALLAVLLLHAGEVVSRDRLLEDLWAGGRRGLPRTRSRTTSRNCGMLSAPTPS
jgi:DNA-binding SARP family transcriptional activator